MGRHPVLEGVQILLQALFGHPSVFDLFPELRIAVDSLPSRRDFQPLKEQVKLKVRFGSAGSSIA